MTLKNVMDRYPVPKLHYGMQVRMDGKRGKIIGYQMGCPRLRVKFDDGDRGFVHPTWAMEYKVKGRWVRV